MARRRKNRPSDPAAILARRSARLALAEAAEKESAHDPARWGIDPAHLSLPANQGVEIAGEPARPRRVRRQDVFDLFFSRGALSESALLAVRRLQADIARLHAEMGGVSALSPRVDRSRAPGEMARSRLEAAERIADVLSLCGSASGTLLRALLEDAAALGSPGGWRAIVAARSGERLADAQGAALRAACENLAGAYRALGRRHLERGGRTSPALPGGGRSP
ncbi:MAG: hypothetical protein ACRED8_13520 [Caulobacteraceae bacterium]